MRRGLGRGGAGARGGGAAGSGSKPHCAAGLTQYHLTAPRWNPSFSPPPTLSTLSHPPNPQGLVYPLDTVRTRLAVCHTSEYGGIWQTAVRLARTEGYAAFYRGLVPSMVRR